MGYNSTRDEQTWDNVVGCNTARCLPCNVNSCSTGDHHLQVWKQFCASVTPIGVFPSVLSSYNTFTSYGIISLPGQGRAML